MVSCHVTCTVTAVKKFIKNFNFAIKKNFNDNSAVMWPTLDSYREGQLSCLL